MTVDAKTAVDQIDDVLQKTRNNGGREAYLAAIALYCSAISRLSPPGSQYLVLMKKVSDQPIADKPYARDEEVKADRLRGILSALKADYEAGRMETFRELVHASLFTDFLEMAEYFLEKEYKDPAAVIAGGVLEEHLRKICGKHGVLVIGIQKGPTSQPEIGIQSGPPLAAFVPIAPVAWASLETEAKDADGVPVRRDSPCPSRRHEHS